MTRYDIYEKTSLEDRIIVSQNSKWGVIDNKNNVIIPIAFDDVGYKKGERVLFKVKQGEKFNYKCGLYDKDGKELLPTVYDRIYENRVIYGKDICLLKKEGKYGSLNINTGKIIECKFDSITMSCFDDEFFYARTNGFWGMYNAEGQELFAPKYGNIFYAYGLYICQKDKLFGVLDKSQNIIIDFIYNNIKELGDGIFLCEKSGKKGLFKTDGSIIVPCEYEIIERIKKSIFKCVKRKKGKFSVAFTKDSIITPEKYDEIQCIGKNIYVCDGNKQTILNEKGEERFPLKYEKMFAISDEPELFSVLVQGKCGIIKSDGTFLITPKYDNIQIF